MTLPAPHAIFKRFPTFEGWAEPGFERSTYGANIRDWLFAGESKRYTERRYQREDPPLVNEEYFESIALLTAIAHAGSCFRIAELGAGWGRWICQAAVVCRKAGIDFSLIGVEAEPARFELMRMVLRDNYIDPDDHDLLQAAVAARDGEVLLAGIDERRDIYSHQIIRPDEVIAWRNMPGSVIRSVPAYSFKTICATHPYLDLVDIDIQGAEYDALAASFQDVSWKIGVVHIGTHSRDIEKSLKRFFSRLGWRNAFAYPGNCTMQTRFGEVTFTDGVQTWVNPERPDILKTLVA